jgi:hypothetical protein
MTVTLLKREICSEQLAYSGDDDRLFRPNVTGHSAISAL